jgi:hypothetical protein
MGFGRWGDLEKIDEQQIYPTCAIKKVMKEIPTPTENAPEVQNMGNNAKPSGTLSPSGA